MKEEQGFVLIIMILFLQIMALMGLYVLNSSILETKISNQLARRNSLIIQSEKNFLTVEADVMKKQPACVVPVVTSQQMKIQLVDGVSSCHLSDNNYDFYYMIEALGMDTCAYIDNVDQHADYYRISLLGVDKQSEGAIFLQSTLIKPGSSIKGMNSDCQEGMRRVRIGRQMWRENY